MQHVFTVQGMTCGHCERAVTQAVQGVDDQAQVKSIAQPSAWKSTAAPAARRWARPSPKKATRSPESPE